MAVKLYEKDPSKLTTLEDRVPVNTGSDISEDEDSNPAPPGSNLLPPGSNPPLASTSSTAGDIGSAASAKMDSADNAKGSTKVSFIFISCIFI